MTENTLIDSYRILRPGGASVFGEPVLDTHVFASLAASLIRAFEMRQETRVFTKKEDQILATIEKRSTLKRTNLRSDRKDVLKYEDKFQFPINYMRKLAYKIGYSDFECKSSVVTDFGQMIKSAIARVFLQVNADAAKLDEYAFIFDIFNLTYGEPMREDLKASFSFFVFVK